NPQSECEKQRKSEDPENDFRFAFELQQACSQQVTEARPAPITRRRTGGIGRDVCRSLLRNGHRSPSRVIAELSSFARPGRRMGRPSLRGHCWSSLLPQMAAREPNERIFQTRLACGQVQQMLTLLLNRNQQRRNG